MVVSQDIVRAFWEQVVFKPGGCWLWRGAATGGSPGNPYGIFVENGVREYAHRFAYKLSCGDLGIERPIVRHTCDTRLCVNPAHLRGSTQQGNIKDAVRKGRWMTEARRKHLEKQNAMRDRNGQFLRKEDW